MLIANKNLILTYTYITLSNLKSVVISLLYGTVSRNFMTFNDSNDFPGFSKALKFEILKIQDFSGFPEDVGTLTKSACADRNAGKENASLNHVENSKITGS